MVIRGVARIVFRRDNRPAKHAHTPHLGGLAAARCQAADEPVAATEDVEESYAEDIVVTATRDRSVASVTPASISRVDDETIAAIGSKHQADVLNRNAGVYIQRGSGAESLGAIRSPVLAGAGACGAFLVAEDSLPIRPTGFCNLNEMFEVNYEQARQIEVLRGPGSSMFGASAVHGVINVITPGVHAVARVRAGRRGRIGFLQARRLRAGALGPNPTRRLRRVRRRHSRAGLARRLGRRRGQAQSAGRHVEWAAGNCALRAAGTVLNQETAGFIQGYNSYKRRGHRAQQSESRSVSRCLERARVGAVREPRRVRRRQPAERRRHLSPLAHGFPAALPDRQAARTQRADQLHAERHRDLSRRDFLTTRVTLDAETGRLRAHRVPARAGHRRRAARQCHSPGGFSLRLHRRFQHGGRHARARVPHRPTTSRSPPRCAPTRLTTTTTTT